MQQNGRNGPTKWTEGIHRAESRGMYSERLMALFRSQAHAATVEGATHEGQAGNQGMGPWLTLRFRVEDGIVTQAGYTTYGCPAIMACSEAVCALSEGRHLAALQAMVTAEVAGRSMADVNLELSTGVVNTMSYRRDGPPHRQVDSEGDKLMVWDQLGPTGYVHLVEERLQ